MKSFWRKQMQEKNTQQTYTEHSPDFYDCQCCHCKKIFMLLVLIILTFMAGIMVGNCGRCHYSDMYYQNHTQKPPYPHIKKKLHRGLHPIPNTNTPAQTNTSPLDTTGGFIIEIDQSN